MCLSSKHINAYLKAKLSMDCRKMSPRWRKALKILLKTIFRLKHYPYLHGFGNRSVHQSDVMKAPFGEKGTQAMIVIYSLVGLYFPCLITWASFAHITLLSKTSPMARCYGERQRAQQIALLRMCAVTSITLTLCWLPSQTIYVLTPFGVTQIGSTLHRAGEIVAMFNSWINPLI